MDSLNELKDSLDLLNDYRNKYYTEGSATERGRLANAINDILPKFVQIFPKTVPHKPISMIANEDIKIGHGTWKLGTTVYKCPACKSFIARSNECCTKCGQKIDWEQK